MIYRGVKGGKLYIGKTLTKDSTASLRYSADDIRKFRIAGIDALDNLPHNAVTLGVEELILQLNGGAGAANIANKIPATIKEIYMVEGRLWLNQNIPNWETLFKFQ